MPASATSQWRQLNLTCDDWLTAEQVGAASLGPLLTRAQAAGEITSWWFTRKGGTWRVRFASSGDGFTKSAAATLLRADGVQAVAETIYEPETTAFGGPEAMEAAHRLFHADSRHVLGKIADSGRELHRELPVVLASRLLRAARQEWYEQGDCWDQLAAHRDDGNAVPPPAATVRAMLTLMTATADTCESPMHSRPDWGSAFDDAGRLLAELSSRGTLTRGLRAVLTHHLLFLFNRHGVSAADQRALASAASEAVFGPAGAGGDMTRKPGSDAARVATVCPVTMTASISDEDRAGQLRNALADHIKGFGTFQNPQVEAAFRTVPRHLFLPAASLDDAYSRDPVVTRRAPDGTSLSSASSPKLVAVMLGQLQVLPGQRVLEVGAATGFNAALIAELTGPAGTVVTIELDSDLASEASENLRRAGYPGPHVACGDGALGDPRHAPYDRIIVTAEAWDISPAWWDQLAPRGRIVVPVRLHGSGLTRSVSFDRLGQETLVSDSAAVCGFVPMRGIAEHAEQRIQLDSDAVLKVDAADQPDAPALAQALRCPPVTHWTGIPVRHDEPAEHLDLWLATAAEQASFSRLTVTRQARERGLADPAKRWAGASLYEGGTLAYLTARPLDDDANELGVTAHGPGSTGLAATMLALLREWDRQRPGQPAITARRLTSTQHKQSTPPGFSRLLRPHTAITIAW
jgi:protein-L-isoaspartate(D-aspartate) O-methyltransferase